MHDYNHHLPAFSPSLHVIATIPRWDLIWTGFTLTVLRVALVECQPSLDGIRALLLAQEPERLVPTCFLSIATTTNSTQLEVTVKPILRRYFQSKRMSTLRRVIIATKKAPDAIGPYNQVQHHYAVTAHFFSTEFANWNQRWNSTWPLNSNDTVQVDLNLHLTICELHSTGATYHINLKCSGLNDNFCTLRWEIKGRDHIWKVLRSLHFISSSGNMNAGCSSWHHIKVLELWHFMSSPGNMS